ncbi:MAG: PIG-L deacetylase family protein [Anaerolineales bacterium]
MSEDHVKAPDAWEKPQIILVILAHPDDPEFFCGASLARWARAGHEIHYFLLTCGDKGFNDSTATASQICTTRHAEQNAAAAIIGVKSVRFLDLEDGYLVPSIDLRREVVRIIRQVKPDILVTCDPTHLFTMYQTINHPDHRAAGQVVLDAVFPAAGNPFFFPELIKDEGLQPHQPGEVWVSLTSNPTVTLDVTDTWEIKVRALKEHKSQIGDSKEFEERMRARKSERSTEENIYYEEKFRVIKFR